MNSIIEARDTKYFMEKFIKDKSITLHDFIENLSMRENENPESNKELESRTEEGILEVKESLIK